MHRWSALIVCLLWASSPWAAAPWQRTSPAEAGMSVGPLEAMREYLSTSKTNFHAVLIAKGDRLVFEGYFPGRDASWGDDHGVVDFDAETLHDIRSVSKSVTALLLGIAVAEKAIDGIDQPLVDYFRDIDLPDRDAKRRILLRHALGMSAGLEWDESLPYSDPRNSEIRMATSDDPLAYVLTRPLIASSGERFNYNGGLTELLAAVIERATGDDIEAYARSRFFPILGIEHVEWMRHAAGPAAASGLRLTGRDFLKIGYLVLKEGRWGDVQVVSRDWVRSITQRRMDVAGTLYDVGYGYQWWMVRYRTPDRVIDVTLARGNGGQRLFVVPELDLVVATLAGYYNTGEATLLTQGLMTRFILPSLGIEDATLARAETTRTQ